MLYHGLVILFVRLCRVLAQLPDGRIGALVGEEVHGLPGQLLIFQEVVQVQQFTLSEMMHIFPPLAGIFLRF
jgi:hypothetical protein